MAPDYKFKRQIGNKRFIYVTNETVSDKVFTISEAVAYGERDEVIASSQ